jgi:hypothetical protein
VGADGQHDRGVTELFLGHQVGAGGVGERGGINAQLLRRVRL